MRYARAKDHWRGVKEIKKFRNRLTSIELADVTGLGTGRLEFESGITVIVGRNGAGKSTLLHLVYQLLVGVPASGGGRRVVRPKDGILQANFECEGRPHEKLQEYPIQHDKVVPSVVADSVSFLEPGTFGPDLLTKIEAQTNFGEMLEGLEPATWKSENIKQASYIMGRDYQSVEVLEINEWLEIPVPFFRVKWSDVEYDSLDMGMGEFCVFYTLWFLHTVKRNQILLIEEPEAFLSPHAQVALMDVIAEAASDKQLFVLATSHSPHVIQNVDIESIRILSARESPNFVTTLRDRPELLSVLGMSPPRNGQILVEDRAAADFLSRLLGRRCPHILSTLNIVGVGSVDDIIKVLNLLPPDNNPLCFIGVLDGDMREKHKDTKTGWTLLFLPSSVPPDELLKKAAFSNIEHFTELVGATESFRLILEGTEGTDHHDWILELARQSSMNGESLRAAAFQCWELDENGKAEADELCEELRTLS